MRVKVATFNLFNMALPGINYYEGFKYSHEEYNKKIDWTARQLNDMEADIVGFQEVFHKRALEAALEKSGLYPGCQAIVLDEVGDKPRVGLVSRFPVVSCESITEFPPISRLNIPGVDIPIHQFRRPVLRAVIKLPTNTEVVVFVVHLKSKRPIIEDEEKRFDFYEIARGEVHALILRAMEALALRCLILKDIENTQTPVILLGDLNDYAHSVTTEMLMGKPPQKYYPTQVKLKIWDTLLFSAIDIQIKKAYRDVFYTHMHNGQYEALDHILVSEEFISDNPKRIGYIEHVRFFNDHLVDQASTDEEEKRYQSDHGQVMVSIKLNH